MNTTELHVNFLMKASSAISRIQNSETQKILRSHYFSRYCQIIGKSRLPQKHFSQETRCTHCFLEWTKETEISVKAIKLTKRQRHRIISKGKLEKKSQNKEYLLHSNNLVKKCSFCKHVSVTPVLKPSANYKEIKQENSSVEHSTIFANQKQKQAKQITGDKYQSNVYFDSKKAFSQTEQNTLQSLIKEPPKIIKNNKRKKDKFAGLCQTAVIAALKLKETKEKQNIKVQKRTQQNKLNLFLKPSC